MSMETMRMLEMVVDTVGLVICLAAITLVIRSRRYHCRRSGSGPRTTVTDFRDLLDARRIGQEAETAFGAIAAAVTAHRQQFMSAIEHAAPDMAPLTTARQEDVAPVNTPAANSAPWHREGHDAGKLSPQTAPATMHLARKIRQRQQSRHLH